MLPCIVVQREPLLDGALLDTTVANDILSKVRQSIPKKYPLIRLATTIAQHCEDSVLMGIPPAPNTSRFIAASELTALGNNTSLADTLETILRAEVREKYEPYLKTKLGGQWLGIGVCNWKLN